MIPSRGWLLDTNVVSELGRGPRAAPAVLLRMRDVPAADCCWSAVTLAELAEGVATATLVTRNTRDFVAAGVALVDPWQAPAP